MILSFDLWHKDQGFGFTLIIWEQINGEYFIKLDFEWQIKLFGKDWGTGK